MACCLPTWPPVPIPVVPPLLPCYLINCRPTLDASTLLQQLQQGHLPSDSLPELDRDVWRAASRITGTHASSAARNALPASSLPLY
jgi:hypothetical protein